MWHSFCGKETILIIKTNNIKYHGDFYCFNSLHSFRTENKLKSDEKVCKNKYFCRNVIPSAIYNVLEFDQYMKSYKIPYIIYAHVDPLIN